MQILIDHGAWRNFGDVAMLQGICAFYQRCPEITKFVVNDRLQYSGESIATFGAHPANIGRRIVFQTVQNLRGMRGYHRLLPSSVRSKVECLLSCRELRRKGGSLYDEFEGEFALDDFCSRFDALHVAGGGYFTDAFSGVVFEKAILIDTFAKQGKPVVLTGQQFGPFRTPAIQQVMGTALQNADFIGTREPTFSMEVCAKAGVNDRTVLMGDDSFGMASAEDGEVDEVLANFRLRRSEFLAINIRVSTYSITDKRKIEQFCLLVNRISNQLKIPAIVVPICVGEGESDIDAGRQLQSLQDGKHIQVMDLPNAKPSVIKGVLGAAFAGIGTSYHFCTFCLSQGVPAVSTVQGPYYVQKGQGLAEFWGFPEICHILHDRDGASSWEEMCAFLRSDDARAKLAVRSKSAHAVWNQSMGQVVDLAFGRETLRS